MATPKLIATPATIHLYVVFILSSSLLASGLPSSSVRYAALLDAAPCRACASRRPPHSWLVPPRFCHALRHVSGHRPIGLAVRVARVPRARERRRESRLRRR